MQLGVFNPAGSARHVTVHERVPMEPNGTSDKMAEEAGGGLPPAPLDLNFVIERVFKYIWKNYSKSQPVRFIVAGSYAAAVFAFEKNNEMRLRYNDIDVYIESQDEKDEVHEHIVPDGVWYEEDVLQPEVPSFEVNFVKVGKLRLRKMIDDFDINCVMVGFEVSPVMDQDYRVAPTLTKVYIHEMFKDFVRTRHLKINPKCAYPAATLIRLMKKSHQLGFPFELPDRKALVNLVHRRCFANKNYEKFDALPQHLKDEILSVFLIRREFWKDRNHNFLAFYEQRMGKFMWRFIARGDVDAGTEEEDDVVLPYDDLSESDLLDRAMGFYGDPMPLRFPWAVGSFGYDDADVSTHAGEEDGLSDFDASNPYDF
jgi:hypothetical protein